MPKVSVIIPVYNVEKYLRECLDSVVNQTLKDIEIICVDDGSKDSSGVILDEYASKDNRIKVIHKENGGYGKAMNVGIDNATGEYIGIVEPDDYIELNMYEVLYNKAIETNVDFVKSDFYRFSEDYIQCRNLIDWSNVHYNRVIRVKNEKSIFNIGMNTWTGIYKTDFIKVNNIRYNETPGARYQDQGFWFQSLMFADTVYFINRAFYHYRFFKTNSTNNPNGYEWIKTEYNYIYNLILQNKKQDYLSMYYRFKFANYLFNYRKLDRLSKKEKLDDFRNSFIDDYKSKNIDLLVFNDYEKKAINLLIKDKKKFYRKMLNRLTLAQKIFSIKNQNSHKIVRIFGIKLKFKRKFYEEKERLRRIEHKIDMLTNRLAKFDAYNEYLMDSSK